MIDWFALTFVLRSRAACGAASSGLADPHSMALFGG